MGENLNTPKIFNRANLPEQIRNMAQKCVNVCRVSEQAKQDSRIDPLGEIFIPSYFEFTSEEIESVKILNNGDLIFTVRLSHDYNNDILITILFDIGQEINEIQSVGLICKYDVQYVSEKFDYAF